MLTIVPTTESTSELLNLCRIVRSSNPYTVRQINIDLGQVASTAQIALTRVLLTCPRIESCTLSGSRGGSPYPVEEYVLRALAALTIRSLRVTPRRA